jgi:predicted outer membrane repeat protein
MKMGRRVRLAIYVLTLSTALLAIPVVADETTPAQARQLVRGWLALHSSPLEAALGNQIASVETFHSEGGAALYHVVSLEPTGFVIVAGDDLAEPIIAFAEIGAYDPTTYNPLHALVTQDIPRRVADIRESQATRNGDLPQHALDAQSKWQTLSDASGGRSGAPPVDIDDPRVPPLLETRWGQRETITGDDCYNYYTPNHYPCGCGATGLAQVLRYHVHPTAGVGTPQFIIIVDDSAEFASLRGGDGNGGPYDWANMVTVPDDGCTDVQRQAIGALCYDAGVAQGASYAADVTVTSLGTQVPALLNTFGYSNAVYGSSVNQGNNLLKAVHPNLDANNPVFLGIVQSGQGIGHFVVCDGYGFNGQTLYHHINMGWDGSWDAWYNLPDFGPLTYNAVRNCSYNVFVDGSGEIISGRVTTVDRQPIAGASVIAEATDGGSYAATTDERGIYAVAKIPAASEYTITVTHPDHDFAAPQVVNTGTSGSSVAGNVWGVDFVASGPAPVAEDVVLMMAHGSTKSISLVGWDDGLPNPPGALSYIITSLPAVGTLTDPGAGTITAVPHALGAGGSTVNYTSPSDTGGTVSFDYLVNDGGMPPEGGDSSPATVTVELVYIPTGVLCVDARATGLDDGLDWDNACQYLQDALARAACASMPIEIHVAQGTHYPDAGMFQRAGSRSASFHLLSDVTILGGYAGVGAPEPDARDIENWETILSGDLNGDDEPDFTNREDNARHVVDGSGCSNTAILEGVTIKSGYGYPDRGCGGGVFVRPGSPTLRHCMITDNAAMYYGGGIYIQDSTVALHECVITNNAGARYGGGLYTHSSTVTLEECVIAGNHASYMGGGLLSRECALAMQHCVFEQNTSEYYAGAVYAYLGTIVLTDCTFLQNHSSAGGAILNYLLENATTIAGCVFEGNTSTQNNYGWGGNAGAIYNYRCAPIIVNCKFVGNEASGRGAAIRNYDADSTIANCLFIENSALSDGGAIYNQADSAPLFANCTVAENAATANGGGMYSTDGSYPTIRNSIFWGNTQDAGGSIESAQIYLDGVSATVTYSCIQDTDPNDGSVPFGGATNGNIDDDPLFTDPGTGALRLGAGSPSIDAGDNADVTPDTTDLDGDGDITEPIPFDMAGCVRFYDDPDTIDTGAGAPPIVDQGAYEFHTAISGDLDGDCDIDLADFDFLSECLAGPDITTPPPGCDPEHFTRADLEGDDGDVDLADFATFQQSFGG